MARKFNNSFTYRRSGLRAKWDSIKARLQPWPWVSLRINSKRKASFSSKKNKKDSFVDQKVSWECLAFLFSFVFVLFCMLFASLLQSTRQVYPIQRIHHPKNPKVFFWVASLQMEAKPITVEVFIWFLRWCTVFKNH